MLRAWLAQGAALPLRYHLLWPGEPDADGTARPQARGHGALRTAQDSERQLAGDTTAVHDIAETLRVRCINRRPGDHAKSRSFFADGAEGRIRFAHVIDHGARGPQVHLPGAHQESAHLTSLRIDLTVLTDLLLHRNPGLEATR